MGDGNILQERDFLIACHEFSELTRAVVFHPIDIVNNKIVDAVALTVEWRATVVGSNISDLQPSSDVADHH